MRKIVGIVIIASVGFGAIFFVNYLNLSMPLNNVLEQDSRNSGIVLSAHYENYINPSVLVIDVKNIEGTKSAADVFRLFLNYADEMQEKRFEKVLLSCKGDQRFFIEGLYFETIGKEFSYQNPVYTMRTFSENLYEPSGARAYGTWTGGVLGVMGKQMEDFSDFHKSWYLRDCL
jgi:hypothetical protein